MTKFLTTLCVTTHTIKDQMGLNIVPSTPSTKLVETVIDRFFEHTNLVPDDVRILIGFDKKSNRDLDEVYHQNLLKLTHKYKNYELLVNVTNTIDAITTATANFLNVIFSVETETFTLWEHDRPATRFIDMKSIIDEMSHNYNINYIRFNGFSNNNIRYNNLIENGENPSSNIPLIPTFRWSNSPQITRTNAFKNWFSTFVYPTHNEGGFVEGPLCELMAFYCEKLGLEEAIKRFGTYVYGNWDEDPYHEHLNGSAWI